MTQTISERLDKDKEHQEALKTWYGPLIRLRNREHADIMQHLQEFGGIMVAAQRDGARGEPNKFFLSPFFRTSDVYREIYAVQFYIREGFSKERAWGIRMHGYRYY